MLVLSSILYLRYMFLQYYILSFKGNLITSIYIYLLYISISINSNKILLVLQKNTKEHFITSYDDRKISLNKPCFLILTQTNAYQKFFVDVLIKHLVPVKCVMCKLLEYRLHYISGSSRILRIFTKMYHLPFSFFHHIPQ